MARSSSGESLLERVVRILEAFTPEDRTLTVGEVSRRAGLPLSLRELAMPVLEELLRAVGHHAQLGILDGDEVLFVERLSSEAAVINYTRIAARLPIHASSSGLVLLAHAPAAQQQRVLDGPLARFTPATITDPAELRRSPCPRSSRSSTACPTTGTRSSPTTSAPRGTRCSRACPARPPTDSCSTSRRAP